MGPVRVLSRMNDNMKQKIDNKKKSNPLTFHDIRIGLTVVFSSLLNENHERAASYLEGIDTYVTLLEAGHKSGLSMATILQRVNIMKLHYVRYLGGNPLSQTFTEVKVTGGGASHINHVLTTHVS